jgi:hypothetical protein
VESGLLVEKLSVVALRIEVMVRLERGSNVSYEN